MINIQTGDGMKNHESKLEL